MCAKPLSELVAKACVFGTRAREHGHELPSKAINVSKIFSSGQLAIRDIDEIVTADILPQLFKVGAMNAIVAAIAAEDLMRYRDGSSRGNIHPKDQLFEVWPMIFVETISYARLRDRVQVFALNRYGGRVVMDPAGVQFELLDDVQSKPEEDVAAANANQGVEAACDAIVVDGSLFLGRKAQG